MTAGFRGNFRSGVLLVLIMLPAALSIFSCRSTRDLVLDDPAFREDMVADAIEGKRFKITPEDHPEIRRLITDNNPEFRQAGVLIAIQANDRYFHPWIVRAALDADSRVSTPAMEEIDRRPEMYRQEILDLLNENDPSLRAGGLRLLAHIGGDDVVGILISHFNDPDPNVRNQASLSVREITDRNNPELRAALGSADSRTAATAYRTLGRYTDPADAPLFIEAFSSSDAEVRKEAQLAILRLGTAGLPFLHIEAADRTRPYRTRISALEVVQGLRSPDSLPLLLELLNDSDSRVSEKARTILGTYGSEAVPRLAEVYASSGDVMRIRIIRLMGDIRSLNALPTLMEALDSPSDEVRIAAMNALRLYGTEARVSLRNRIVNGTPRTRSAGIILLREQADPWLVTREDGSPNQQALLLLITMSGQGQLSAYLTAARIPRLARETVLSLNEAWNLAEEFIGLEKQMSDSGQSYLRAWRQWELYSLASRRELQKSFDDLHVYFETRDLGALERARITRAESRRLDGLARDRKKFLDGLSDPVKERGREALGRYREIREILVRIWEYVTPELKGVAEAVYNSRGLDPVSMARESALLE